jgi:hypothetical protein
MSPNKPDWLPDWKDISKYPDPKEASGGVWAWEFLRRNPQYQQLWEQYAALPPGPVYAGHSAYTFRDICERFEREFGVKIPAPPAMTIADPEFNGGPGSLLKILNIGFYRSTSQLMTSLKCLR